MIAPSRAAASARRQLIELSRPSGSFDANRYFRSVDGFGFLNVGTQVVREMARRIVRDNQPGWTVNDGLAFADALISDRYLEVKGLGIEVLARYRRSFTPKLLPVWKRWLSNNYSTNWATTDAICGLLNGPLFVSHPRLVTQMLAWTRDSNMWVRRASAVSLVPAVRRGIGLETAYEVARRLHGDREDLLHKAVGWLLREAGKIDPSRLERYLRTTGPRMPRTTVRYAIERFPSTKRRELLAATKTRQGPPEGRPLRVSRVHR